MHQILKPSMNIRNIYTTLQSTVWLKPIPFIIYSFC